MPSTTTTKPTQPTDEFFIGVDWYVLFFPSSSPTVNILEGWKVTNINKDANVTDQIESSHQQSDIPWKGFINGAIDAGSLTVEAMYDATIEMPSMSGITQSRTTGQQGKVQIGFADSSVQDTKIVVAMECAANLSEFGAINNTRGQIVTTQFKFKLSGQPTYPKMETTP